MNTRDVTTATADRVSAPDDLPMPSARPEGAPTPDIDAGAGMAAGRSIHPSSQPALVDRLQRAITYLRVSVTDRCNYRCTYCMPEDGVDHVGRSDILSFEEIVALVRCFVDLGVTRVRLTGGEPTVRRDLVDLVRLLRAVPGLRDIALSTNGHLLAELALPLRQAGVDRLNVSVDTLDPAKFARITRRGELARVLAGLAAARAAGFASIKLNAVAIKGFNDGEVGALCQFAFDNGFVPRFIEQMPMADGALFVPGTLLSAAEIRGLIAASYPDHKLVASDGAAAAGGGPARYHRLVPLGAPTPVSGREIGLITPMTEHFCDTCNRVRLSSTGALHTCLAHDDAVDLRSVLHARGPSGVTAAIRDALTNKRDGHNFQLIGLGGPRKAMVQIGG
ncbi:MAG TPA: GTP 3',8-cyclase MoaA [Polyangia bacterium]